MTRRRESCTRNDISTFLCRFSTVPFDSRFTRHATRALAAAHAHVVVVRTRSRWRSSWAWAREYSPSSSSGASPALPPSRALSTRPFPRCRAPTEPRRLHADIRYPPTAAAPPPPDRRSIVFLGACHLSRGTLQAAYVLPRVVGVPRLARAPPRVHFESSSPTHRKTLSGSPLALLSQARLRLDDGVLHRAAHHPAHRASG